MRACPETCHDSCAAKRPCIDSIRVSRCSARGGDSHRCRGISVTQYVSYRQCKCKSRRLSQSNGAVPCAVVEILDVKCIDTCQQPGISGSACKRAGIEGKGICWRTATG